MSADIFKSLNNVDTDYIKQAYTTHITPNYTTNSTTDIPSNEDINKTINPLFTKQLALQELIQKHGSIFNPNLPPEGLKAPKFNIKLKPGTSTFRKRYPRRLSPDHETFQDEQIAELLRLNIIEEVTDTVPCAFPTVVALNKTFNKLRFCIDYRELNEYTETYMYPLPYIPDTIRSLKGKSLFANLDMKLGFHQLLIKEEDRK